MKAVNLIPVDERRAGSGGAPPYGIYGLLGGLAAVLIAVTLLVVMGNQVSDRRAKLAAETTKAAAAKQQADALVPYANFATLQQKRLATVKSLAASRFQWSRAFDQVSHVVGTSVWLSGLTGTVAPGVTVEGSNTSETSTFRADNPNPAMELAGCARSNDDVVGLMSRLRAMTGVQRVTLADAAKDDQAQPISGSGDGTSCGSIHYPAFHIVVFYAPLSAPSAAITATSTATTTSAPATTSSSSGTSSTASSTSGSTP